MPHNILSTRYTDDPEITEIGIDEVGRGPLFGRVYVAGTILPKQGDGDFDHTLMKDSKKFSSQARLEAAYDHVIQHCIDYEMTTLLYYYITVLLYDYILICYCLTVLLSYYLTIYYLTIRL